MKRASQGRSNALQSPPEKVTLVYCNREGAHSFSILEVPGLIVLDHDLARAFEAGIRGAGELVSSVCKQSVQYEVDMTFDEFKESVDSQEGTANTHKVVTVPGKIHRAQAAA
jgi:hypothetical protein